MNHQLRLYATFAVAAVCVLPLSGAAFATDELAESEDLACTVCHDEQGSKRLTDKGKYFELMRSMDGYADIEASFGKCTFCHRRKPGSKKLTKAGKGFANSLGNMEALVEWVRDLHPAWPEAEEEELMKPASEAGGAETEEGDGLEPTPAH